MRKVFLENLPRYTEGNRKNKINWKQTVGYKVHFIYEDIEDDIKIIGYNDYYLNIEYLNKTCMIKTGNFSLCKLGKILNKYTSDFKIEINTKFQDNKRDLTITDREYRPKYKKDGTLKQNEKWYKYTCNVCSWTEGWSEESILLSGQGCSCCHSTTLVKGINDIPTTNPWMVKYFQGGYDEAKLYTHGCDSYIYPICPECGRIKDKKMKIVDIFSNKSIGCSCSDNTSYPEKFMFNVLTQLNTSFKIQLSNSTFEWCKNYRYDFYFKYNDKQYIIETHGGQHPNTKYYDNGFERSFSKKFEDCLKNDKIKKELALANGIGEENYIVVDCSISKLDFIKQNILESKLAEIFNLSKINWLECEEFAQSNLVKKVCEIKKNNPNLTTLDISLIVKLEVSTIRKYLTIGNKLGWCHYYKRNVQPIICLNTKEVFISVGYCSKNSLKIFGTYLNRSIIYKCIKEKYKQYKGYTFIYIKDLTLEEYIKYGIKEKLIKIQDEEDF